jgi:DNA-binding LacI/PurR family transcriptional regulator
MVPKLTTIQQPGVTIAERCVKILVECIQKKKAAVREQISFSVITGESTRSL